ncbi:MAG: hypothetical protein AAF798_15940 [Bacteroidota bacterium]
MRLRTSTFFYFLFGGLIILFGLYGFATDRDGIFDLSLLVMGSTLLYTAYDEYRKS